MGSNKFWREHFCFLFFAFEVFVHKQYYLGIFVKLYWKRRWMILEKNPTNIFPTHCAVTSKIDALCLYTQGSLHILRLNIQKWGLPFWFLGCPLYFFDILIHFYNLSAVIWFTKGNQFETVTSFIIAQLLFHLSHSAIVIITMMMSAYFASIWDWNNSNMVLKSHHLFRNPWMKWAQLRIRLELHH